MALLTPLNVNCHASDGRKVSGHFGLFLWPKDQLQLAGLVSTCVVSSEFSRFWCHSSRCLCCLSCVLTVGLLFQSTPLHLAAGYNRVKTVQLLLQHGADVHAKDKG